ncbi:MAG: type IV secretion system DNA-binding domain-containing protein [Chloroflexi bacterium]|nr:type IV secretion system DNA-binding domain-containing protein [Chloroflexota bacterium]MCY3588084.1 type IV secretion system DNA-binding domain-containing protein [Chloroflexota bacterium]MCY3607357.1 type IV secretion system DNA-binding domain-containing protein [Acidimicrobiaceae bacterium]MDE2709052.1 type IV secretion system DNA-binding domain-containing protein [Chloroflexota bacterium]
MRFNPLRWFSRSAKPSGPALLAITPPRTGQRTLLGVENLLGSIAAPEPFALELAADERSIGLFVRCAGDQIVRGQVGVHYPQARIRDVPAERDYMRLGEDEQAWSLVLRASGPEYAPLRVFRDQDLVDPGSDPLLAPLGALTGLKEGERLVSRLLLRSLGPQWSRHYQEKAQPVQIQSQPRPAPGQPVSSGPDPLALAVLIPAGFGFYQGYTWLQAGEIWNLAALCAGAAVLLIGGGWAWRKWKKSRDCYFDPQLVKEKISRGAFEAELELVAVLPEGSQEERAEELLERLAAAYRHYDHPSGAQFESGKVGPLEPGPPRLHPRPPGMFRRRSVLGVREAAALWHPPSAADESPLVARAGARALPPAVGELAGGAEVGTTSEADREPVHFPDDLLGRHHLYVARTRMGKSTLMRHIVGHKLRRKAEGLDRDAIVVVDPHADLVQAILEETPEELVDQVRLIDLADPSGAPGINLLDARVFADRDRTADSVVRVARGLWEQWGPRMQSILEHTVKTLHEANSHPLTEPDRQHTILDGLRLLTDDEFRAEVLTRVSDPYLLEWWARDFGGWRREYRAEALAPVQTRLSYYASSRRARAILGQPKSTIDLRKTILEGGILLVSTAQGTVGRDVAALVGASLLNLVDSVIREQERLPLAQRRGALVVVDEMQTIPGVEFESMLAELGKYGASFVLATQSLAKLQDLSPTMRHTLMANVGCLCVFQVSGEDARDLLWDLGRERVSEEDVVSQPVHHCYVRATVGTQRMPVFSMTVRKPEPGDPLRAARIREAASAYVTSAHELERQQTERQRAVTEFRERMEARREADKAPQKKPKPKTARPEPKTREREHPSDSTAAERDGAEQ